MTDNELFNLCHQVYRLTNWDSFKKYWSSDGSYTVDRDTMTSAEAQTAIIPVYTSDFLLSKLPQWIGDYGEMQMKRGYMSGATGAYQFFYTRGEGSPALEGSAATPLLALLKLTVAARQANAIEVHENS